MAAVTSPSRAPRAARRALDADAIRTPDQRLRVFVSSTLTELAAERAAARRAIEQLRLTPVMFELGARPYPPRHLYRSYLRQSDVFVGIYAEQYGWVAPDMEVSGLEDELRHAHAVPQLLYVKDPAPRRDPRLAELIGSIERGGRTSYKTFSCADQLERQLLDDLALLLTERFVARPDPPRTRELPHPASEFVGRAGELAELAEVLTTDAVRVITLTGTGGIGKTRLAIEAAHAVADRFPDGVVFVPLASRGTDALLDAICTAIGVKDLGQQQLAQLLADALRERRQLLVLDNFEHMLPAARQLASLVERTHHLTVLVTSRTALRLRGEHEVPVRPLQVPAVSDDVDEVCRAEAAQLFCRSSRASATGTG